MNNLTLYCNCFPEHENRRTQFNQKNLMLNAHSIDPEYRQKLSDNNFCFDDVGDNISYLNKWLGDLTGLYWIWKNTSDEIVGTNQYRRFYIDEEIQNLDFDANTVYVSAFGMFPWNMAEQYILVHNPVGLQALTEAINQKTIKMNFEHVDTLNNINIISPANMFFAERKLFDKLCEVLFEIIFEIYNGTKYALPFIQPPGQHRMIAFLAERILNVIYHHTEYYLGKNITIRAINYETL